MALSLSITKDLKMKNMQLLSLISLMMLSQLTLAVDCFEIGAQAESSVHINSITKKGTLHLGEEFKIKANQEDVEGSLATYTFKADKKKYSLSILNESVADDDKRNMGILIELSSLNKIFLGCSL
jgi:hypothetical protein